jgi:hypothetical protein
MPQKVSSHISQLESKFKTAFLLINQFYSRSLTIQSQKSETEAAENDRIELKPLDIIGVKG